MACNSHMKEISKKKKKRLRRRLTITQLKKWAGPGGVHPEYTSPTTYFPTDSWVTPRRRKIRLVASNAKCRYLKKLTCKGILWQVFYPSEAPSSPMTPISPPPYTLYKIRVYVTIQYT